MRRFSKLLFQAILTVLLFSGLGGALRAQTRPPIELALVPAGATFQTKGTAGYLFYGECSVNGQDWKFLPSMKLGNGSPVQWSFGTPEPGTPRQLYRIRISATGGYTAATAATQDTDGDSIPDMQEVENGTSPISADTDNDGISDNQEAANGTSPTRLDMPTFSIVSSWRQASLWKNLNNISSNPTVNDWHIKLEADGTAQGYKTENFWSPGPPSPSSAWNPLDLSGTAAALWTTPDYVTVLPVTVRNKAFRLWGYRYQQFTGDIAKSSGLQGYGVVLERTISIKASRLMPANWRIPYVKVSAAQQNFTQAWHAPGNQPDNPPPAVESGFFTFTKGDNRSSEVTLFVADDGPVPAWPSNTAFGPNRPGNAESRSIQVLYFTKFDTAKSSGDKDGDGVDDALEKQMGLDPAKRNTDGAGYADGDQINQDVLPPADGFRITTRAVDFNARVPWKPDLSAPDKKEESLTTITDLPAATKFQYAKDQEPKYDLNKALQDKISALSPFPDTVPASDQWPIPDPISSLITSSQSNPYDTTAFVDYRNSTSSGRALGDQCRIWATIPESVTTTTTRNLLKVREENTGNGFVTATVTPVTFTIPSGSTVSSNSIDLTAARPTTIPTGPLAAIHGMTVREKLLPVEVLQYPITSEGVFTSLPPVTNGAIRFCRWADAYPQGIRDDQFADKDRDRFQIRIPGIITSITKLKIKATKLNGAVIGGQIVNKTTDGDYEVDMKQVSGAMVSEPILLVSDGDDDVTFNGKGTDNGKNDQTLLADFGSDIVVTFPELGTTECVFHAQQPVGTITLDMAYCYPSNQTLTSIPAEMNLAMERQARKMAEIYRQVGIKVDGVVPVADRLVKFPATWLKPSFVLDKDSMGRLDGDGTDGLMTLVKISSPDSKRIRAGFVNAELTESSDQTVISGKAAADGKDPVLLSQSGLDRTRLNILAHEAGHVVGLHHNWLHEPRKDHWLMRQAAGSKWSNDSLAAKRFTSHDFDDTIQFSIYYDLSP